MAAVLNVLPALQFSKANPLRRNSRSRCKDINGEQTRVVCSWSILPCISSSKNHSHRAASALVAALLINSIPSQAIAETFAHHGGHFCQLAADQQAENILKLDGDSDGMEGGVPPLVMEGMTARNFNPARYAGRWYEVASLKRGFAGQGQEDCHCTQGVYSLDEKNRAIKVETFCVHGSPNGYITGIRGVVKCVGDADMASAETEEERQEMISSKCYLKFPFLPFIPKLPYNVIDTDYDTFALVSGAKDKSFVQIYSRTPNPGAEFIQKYKDYLANIGYNAKQIKDVPQDCENMSMGQLESMMSMPGMEEALENKFPDLGLQRAVQFNPFTSVFDTFKKLVELYFK